MKNKLSHSKYYLIFLLLFTSLISYSQNDSIIIKKTFSSFNYFYNGEQIKSSQVLEVLEVNTEAYDKFKSASEAYVFANIFGVAGIILVAVPAGMSIAGYESNWSMAWAGAGFIIVSIPLFHKYNKSTIKALELYNGSLPQNINSSYKPQLKLGATQNGIGINITF